MITIWISSAATAKPSAAELELGQRLQAAAQERDREDAQQQGGADQHTRDIDCSPTGLEPTASRHP